MSAQSTLENAIADRDAFKKAIDELIGRFELRLYMHGIDDASLNMDALRDAIADGLSDATGDAFAALVREAEDEERIDAVAEVMADIRDYHSRAL